MCVFSAGLGDVIEEVLKVEFSADAGGGGELPKEMRVVSNRMIWSDEGVLVGFSENLLHMFNKDQTGSQRGGESDVRPARTRYCSATR